MTHAGTLVVLQDQDSKPLDRGRKRIFLNRALSSGGIMGIMGVMGPVVLSLGTLVPFAVADTWWTSDWRARYTYLKTGTSQDDVAANNGIVEFDGHLIVTLRS